MQVQLFPDFTSILSDNLLISGVTNIITLTMVGFSHVYCINYRKLHTLKSLELKFWLTVRQIFQNVSTKSLSDRVLLVL